VSDTKKTLELSVPVEQVAAETERVVAGIRQRVKLPGFRPGKAPAALIQSRFESEIRQDVLESLVPKTFRAHAERENLKVVGSPNVTDVHFHKGEPLRFKVEFEVFPDFELGVYRGLTVPYSEPSVSDEDIAQRMEAVREQKAEYVNIDPRPVEPGDHAVVALRSISGIEGPPVEQDEVMLHISDPDTVPAFNDNLLGVTPGEEKEIDVPYPEDYGNRRLAGKTVRFHVTLKGIRRKELPEVNDEFAADLGDYKSVEELREQLRRDLLREREAAATQEAKNKLVDVLVDAHDFPVPEAFIDRQIEASLEARLREVAAQGIDPRQLKLDWEEIRKAALPGATREVKASLLLDKIAEREAIEVMTDEVDREIHRVAKQVREPAAAVRMRFEKDGTLGRIASQIRTSKVLNFLFENATKVPPDQTE
jgi:trigger factor